jgi:hypothetical protein
MTRLMCTALLTGLVASACGSSASPTAPTSPAPIVSTFIGTLEPSPSSKSSALFTFTTAQSGDFSVKITALAPDASVFLDTLYGQPTSDGNCSPVQSNNFSALNTTSISAVITPGTWCVVIRDRGLLTAAESFTLTVTHP